VNYFAIVLFFYRQPALDVEQAFVQRFRQGKRFGCAGCREGFPDCMLIACLNLLHPFRLHQENPSLRDNRASIVEQRHCIFRCVDFPDGNDRDFSVEMIDDDFSRTAVIVLFSQRSLEIIPR